MASKISTEPRRMRRGVTLIELLTVVLILAILMAVALPPYLSAVADSQRETCRANMQTVAGAVRAAYVQAGGQRPYFTGRVTSAVIGPGNALPDLQAVPRCPTGGKYTVAMGDGVVTANNGTVVSTRQFYIRCSNPAHGVSAPGVDSN